jgi:hypothetical protein
MGQVVKVDFDGMLLYVLARCTFLYALLLVSQSCTQNPTATEVFNLRSKCAELGDRLQRDTYGATGATSHYDASLNRCYVRLVVFEYSKNSVYKATELYDGQTHEKLASVQGTDGREWGYLNVKSGDCDPWSEKDHCIHAATSFMDNLMSERPADKK